MRHVVCTPEDVRQIAGYRYDARCCHCESYVMDNEVPGLQYCRCFSIISNCYLTVRVDLRTSAELSRYLRDVVIREVELLSAA